MSKIILFFKRIDQLQIKDGLIDIELHNSDDTKVTYRETVKDALHEWSMEECRLKGFNLEYQKVWENLFQNLEIEGEVYFNEFMIYLSHLNEKGRVEYEKLMEPFKILVIKMSVFTHLGS